ncbi:hypothetical protein BASA81_001883 [Batrachochytrium salamandrivorans]|nr:hypothetical protein BASA81_001883 [Batrachochytrium salamandrivorans]
MTAGVRDKRVPYGILLERVSVEIELCWLLVELLFMVFYFCLFLAYIIIDTQVTTGFEVNGQIRAQFTEQVFPSENGMEKRFGSISSPSDFLQWFDNLVLPAVLLETLPATSEELSIPKFQVYLWTKLVSPTSNGCVNAPAFLWQQVNALNGRSENNAEPLCYPGYSDSNQDSTSPIPGLLDFFPNSPLNSAPILGKFCYKYSSSGMYSQAINASWLDGLWPQTQSQLISSSTRLVALQGYSFYPSYNYWAKFTFAIEFSNAGQVLALAPEILSGQLDSCSALYICGQELVLLALGSITAVFIISHLILFLALRARAVRDVFFSSSTSAMTERMSIKRKCWLGLSQLVGVFVIADLAQVVLGMITLSYISQTLWQSRTPAGNIPLDVIPLPIEYIQQITNALQLKNSMTLIFGLQVLLFNIQVFKYFPALPCFTLPRRAWEVACFDVFKVFMLYLICILAFSFSGWLAFSNLVPGYQSFQLSMNSAVQAILGEISFSQAAVNQGGEASVFVWFFYLFYIIVFLYILQALFFSAVLDGFRVAFRESQGREYLTEFATQLLCCFPGRRNGGKPAPTAINFSAMSKEEVRVRLRDWKARKANRDLYLISWIQLRDALRGFTYNRLDVPDEEVDAIFRLVDIVHFVQSGGGGGGGGSGPIGGGEEEDALSGFPETVRGNKK